MQKKKKALNVCFTCEIGGSGNSEEIFHYVKLCDFFFLIISEGYLGIHSPFLLDANKVPNCCDN
jgi:hypothetical protein